MTDKIGAVTGPVYVVSVPREPHVDLAIEINHRPKYGLAAIAAEAVGDEPPQVLDMRPGDYIEQSPLNNGEPFETWVELQNWCNVRADRRFGGDLAQTGQAYFKLVSVYIRTGFAGFIPKFLDATGRPFNGVRAVASWPGAPDLGGEQLYPDYAQVPGHAVAGWSNESGDVGFPYSHGAMFNDLGDGVYNLWPMSPLSPGPGDPVGSDALIGAGWWANTNHDTVNGIWQVVIKGGAGPGPEPPGPINGYYEVLYHNGVEVGRIAFSAPTSTSEYYRALFRGSDELGRIHYE